MGLLMNAFNLGLGVVSLTREKAERFMDEMVERGEISREDARIYVEEVMKKGEEEKNSLRSMIRDELSSLRKDFGDVGRTEIENLEARIKALEDKLNQ